MQKLKYTNCGQMCTFIVQWQCFAHWYRIFVSVAMKVIHTTKYNYI